MQPCSNIVSHHAPSWHLPDLLSCPTLCEEFCIRISVVIDDLCFTQATQSAAIHAKHAQQARAELEEVRRRAADSIRASSVSTEQLRELGNLRAQAQSQEQQPRDCSGPDLQAKLRAAEAQIVKLQMTAQGHAVELIHVDEVRELKNRMAELMADVESLRMAKAEAGEGFCTISWQ